MWIPVEQNNPGYLKEFLVHNFSFSRLISKYGNVFLQFTTARLITIYDNVLLQFTISWLSQFSTTVITIYDRYYNFMTGITIHDRDTCWHYLMMSQYKKISLFSKRICQVINQTRYQNVSLSEKAKRLNST